MFAIVVNINWVWIPIGLKPCITKKWIKQNTTFQAPCGLLIIKPPSLILQSVVQPYALSLLKLMTIFYTCFTADMPVYSPHFCIINSFACVTLLVVTHTPGICFTSWELSWRRRQTSQAFLNSFVRPYSPSSQSAANSPLPFTYKKAKRDADVICNIIERNNSRKQKVETK